MSFIPKGATVSNAPKKNITPLAERMRPSNLDEVVGQERLLGKGSVLRQTLMSGSVHSMIMWGPPGCGKTTLARLFAKYVNADFQALSAIMSGIADVRKALAKARERFAQGRQTILFVDEVHRFNKAQQDAFLPDIESGAIVFVGATTENPSFELNSALLSRCRLGHGKGYQYDHDTEAGVALSQYLLPEELRGREYYHPTNRGREGDYRRQLDQLRADRIKARKS